MNVKRVAAESHHISVIQKTPQIMELYYISFKRQGCLEFTLNRNYHVIFENFEHFTRKFFLALMNYTLVITAISMQQNFSSTTTK